MKFINKDCVDHAERGKLDREVDMLKKLQHPHIVNMREAIDTPKILYLIME